jgi:FAD/FMN-containing dehydrogenase
MVSLLLAYLFVPIALMSGASYNVVNPDDWVHDCLWTFQEQSFPSELRRQINQQDFLSYINYSNYLLIDKPSGLCSDFMTCAFEKCNITQDLNALTVEEEIQLLDTLKNATGNSYDDVASNFGVLNLPDTITFPETVVDVVDAIIYAKEHNLTVSIKSTGHSYAGSYNMKGSLQLNLRELKQYTTDGVVECALFPNASDTACSVAQGRGMNAIIRVGGGEVWSNVYLAVMNANTTVTYGVVGGGAGSVGAAGGWLQGGGLSTGPDRMYGLGVDMVVEIEMVLADARHIKFSPSEWTMKCDDRPTEGMIDIGKDCSTVVGLPDACNKNTMWTEGKYCRLSCYKIGYGYEGDVCDTDEGYIYPRTTVVSGLCNVNPSKDENEWDWQPCGDDEPPFDDLWFAVRGGGGGSYGVVTSLKYQLYESAQNVIIISQPNVTASIVQKVGGNVTLHEPLSRMFIFFFVDYLLNPSKLGIDKNRSNDCGSPALNVNYNQLISLFCGSTDGAAAFLAAWNNQVDSMADPILKNDLKNLFGTVNASYPEFAIASNFNSWVPAGKVPDTPWPAWFPDRANSGLNSWCSAQIPLNLFTSENITHRDLVYETMSIAGLQHLTGGNVAMASDRMNAVPLAERTSGFASATLQSLTEDLQQRLLSTFIELNNGQFIGITELNHICPESRVVLRSDPNQFCPLDYSETQKTEECFSMIETVWEPQLLSKLKGIKLAVDPDGLFYCYACVNSNDTLMEPPTESPINTTDYPINATQSPTLIPSTPSNCIGTFTIGYITDNASWETFNHIGLDNIDRSKNPDLVTKEFLLEPDSTQHGYGLLVEYGNIFYYKYNLTQELGSEIMLNFITQNEKVSDFRVVAVGEACEDEIYILERLIDYSSGNTKSNISWKVTILFVIFSFSL